MTVSSLEPDLIARFMEMSLLAVSFCGTGYLFLFLLTGLKPISDTLNSPGMAVSAGLVFVMLTSFGLGLINIPVTRFNLLIFFLGFCGLTILRLWKDRAKNQPSLLTRKNFKWLDFLVPLLLFFLMLVLRTIQVKEILVPNWYDGLTHTSLLRDYLIAERIPADNIYHVGFHAVAMVVSAILGTNPPETILLLGQWLAAVSGFTFYSLVYRFSYNRFIAGICSILYSSFLLFPSYLLSLGRFPFLLGFALLPFAIITTMDWATSTKSNYWLAVSSIAALALSHYGSLLIWFACLASFIINKLRFASKGPRDVIQFALPPLKRLGILTLPLALIILPKSINLYYHPAILSNMIERFQDTSFDTSAMDVLATSLSEDYFFFFLWVLWLPWSFSSTRKSLFISWLWPFAMWFFTWVQYKIAGFSISSFANLIIFLCLPLAFTPGLLLKQLMVITRLTTRSLPLSRFVMKGLPPILLIVVSSTALLFPPTIDPEKTLLTKDDQLAMQWIRNHTPANAGFMIRTTFWNNKALVPYDGGGWINFLTGRRIGFPKIGELYDLCVFSKQARLDYMYFGPKPIVNGFDLRPEDYPEEYYSIAYQNETVKIFALNCP